MKRKALLIAAAMLLVFMAGCGKNAGEQPKSPAQNSGTPSSTSTSGGTTAATGANSSSNAASNTPSNTSGGTNSATAPTQGTNVQQPMEKVNLGPLKPGEAAAVGPLTVTLKQTTIASGAAGVPPGYVYLLAEIEVKNGDKEHYTLNITDHFKVETPEGKKAPYNVQATAYGDPRLQGSIEPGKSITGWIGYLAKKVDGTYKYSFIHPDWGEATWEFGL